MSRKTGNTLKKAGSGGASGASLNYFFVRALFNVRQNLLVSILTVVTVCISFLLLSLFLLVYVNLEGAADRWGEKVQVVVYFDKEPAPQETSVLRGRIQSLPGTERVDFVSKAEALQRFRSRLKGQESLLEGVPADTLPASYDIRLKKTSRSVEAIDAYVAALKKIPGVSEVQYGEEWVRKFNTFLAFIRLVGGVLGLFLVLAVTFIVSNTIRLTIYARRDELEILRIVGATPLFIKVPFLLEGVLHGCAGAVLAILSLGTVYLVFLNNADSFLHFNVGAIGLTFLPPSYLAGIVAAGMLVGLLGSMASLRRFMQA